MAAPRGLEFYEDNGAEFITGHRSCVRIIHGNGDAKYDRGFAGLAPEPALVTDGSGYAARLIVLPTFGCTLHEPVEQAPGAEGTKEK